jgi:hypothetical protein
MDASVPDDARQRNDARPPVVSGRAHRHGRRRAERAPNKTTELWLERRRPNEEVG